MSILNKSGYYFITTFNDRDNEPPEPQIYNHGGEPVTGLYHWDDRDYWMLEFLNGDAFYHYPIEKIAPKDIYEGIKNGNVGLIISHITECYHYVVEDIYRELILDQKIPIQNIVFLTNSADIEQEIEIVSKKYNLPKIKSAFMATFEYGAKGDMHRYPNEFMTNALEHKKYEKKFLSLNGLWRPHRNLLCAFLKGLNVLDHGHVSLNSVPCDFPSMKDHMFNEFVKLNSNNPDGLKLLIEHEEEIKKLDRIYLEGETDLTHRAAYTGLNNKFYKDTYFSVVTETTYGFGQCGDGYTIGRTCSEKTFKPILYKHPFLLLARPNTLKLLRTLGYKTFDAFIDESYDNEEDDSTRVYMVAKETERLCTLNDKELSNFLNGCREIAEYNFNVLKNKQNFLYWKT